MPRSKRNKQIELAKTKKRGLDWKKRLYEEVRSCVDKYENVFIFSVNDMRNNKMKSVREQWKHSRFFIGKNKIMAMALGRFAEEEYRSNLHKLGQQIRGQRGLLFSNKPVEEVLSWFRSYSEGDYARSGNTATETVHLPAGPLTMFPHNLEPYLRELGLPTTLEKGVIHLVKDHEVCKAGDVLTPETAKILKLLGYEMAEFHVTIDCVWSKDGTFMQLTEKVDTDVVKNKKQKKKLSFSSEVMEKNNAGEDEQMEIEQDEESSDGDDDEDEDEVVGNGISDNTSDVAESAITSLTATSSTPKMKSNDVIEMSDLEEKDNKSTVECNKEISDKIEETNHNEESLKEVEDTNHNEESLKEIEDTNHNEESLKEIEDTNHNEKLLKEIEDTNHEEKISAEIDEKNHMEEIEENSNEPSEINEENASPVPKRGRSRISAKTPRTAKKINISKRESLVKTPDANTSQDSPIFRELRNRSVKVNRKRK